MTSFIMSSQQSAIIYLNSIKRHLFFFAIEDWFLWGKSNSFAYYVENIQTWQIYTETTFVVIGFDPTLYKVLNGYDQYV